MKNRILFKSFIKNIDLGNMAEAEAILSRKDQIQLEIIPYGKTIGILLLYGDFHVKRKEKSTTL